MASALAVKLNQCSTKIAKAHHETNAAVCFSAWLSVHQLLQEYFAVCAGVEQSEEVRESQEKYGWKWVELPEFPLRQLLPLAGETLAQFPSDTALALLIADFCVDARKQNVLAKMAAMESGVIQGLCRLAAQLAAAIRVWDLPNEPSLKGTGLLIFRIFEALHYITEWPTVAFYSKSPEVKREFFSKAKKAWGKVDIGESIAEFNTHFDLDEWDGLQGTNHALFLTFFCFTNLPANESNTHYMYVLRNIAEAWDFKFPSDNQAFLKFMGGVFANLERQSSLLPVQEARLVPELLIILKRTLDPRAVPYDPKLPYFTPALNQYINYHGSVGGLEGLQRWNEFRETTMRKEVQSEAVRMRLQEQSGRAQERADVTHTFVARERGGEVSWSLLGRSGRQLAAPERNSQAQTSATQARHAPISSTRTEGLPSIQDGTSGSAGHEESKKGAGRQCADAAILRDGKRQPQEEAPHANGEDRKGAEASRNEAQEAAQSAQEELGGSRTEPGASHRGAEESRKEAQKPESAGREDLSKEKGGDRVCGCCSKQQKERAPGAPKFKKCARCEGVWYCNAECQRLRWSVHKQSCIRLRARSQPESL